MAAEVEDPLEKKIDGCKNLTTKFVRDWRAKQRSMSPEHQNNS